MKSGKPLPRTPAGSQPPEWSQRASTRGMVRHRATGSFRARVHVGTWAGVLDHSARAHAPVIIDPMKPFDSGARRWTCGLFAIELTLALVSTATTACQSRNESQPPPVATTAGGSASATVTTTVTDGHPDTSTSTETSTATETTVATETSTGTQTGGNVDVPPANCGETNCKGHGSCQEIDGIPVCMCDDGYVKDEFDIECVVDTNCVQLRSLECRQVVNDIPAVGLFFALDYCAGTAVLPSDLGDPQTAFKVLEQGNDIADNPESYATVIEHGVESYVALVVDVSDSLTLDDDLPALVTVLREFVASLEPGPGEADVYVGLYAFGEQVGEKVPFTRDHARVDEGLVQIEADARAGIPPEVGGMGTSLYAAVREAIDETDRIQNLRREVSQRGVLTTGTVVIVTDGVDTSGAVFDPSIIDSTTNNIITVGVSLDIDDEYLQPIGRDGSFLAPEPIDWEQAFTEIATRVDQYPERTYLLAYCSSANKGDISVEVQLTDPAKLYDATAKCTFSANLFGSDATLTCTAESFTNECNGLACGGLTACGACGDDQCCTSGAQCIGPVDSEPCKGLKELCNESGTMCVADNCQPGADVGQPCGEGCQLGVSYCDDDPMMPTCQPAMGLGANCDSPKQCTSNHCGQKKPDNPFDPKVCLLPAKMYDDCGTTGGCEEGSYCDGTVCRPLKFDIYNCATDSECLSATCTQGAMAKFCDSSFECYWDWQSKLP